MEITNDLAHEEYTGLLAYAEALECLLHENSIDLPEHKAFGSMHGSSNHSEKTANILDDIEERHRAQIRRQYLPDDSLNRDSDRLKNNEKLETEIEENAVDGIDRGEKI